MYRWFLRPVLFRLSAELAHQLGIAALRLLASFAFLLNWVADQCRPPAALQTRALGLTLPSPLGLAAGLDKNAEAFVSFAALGFGFVEVGTLTPKPQPGNPKPRLFRLPLDRALVNRMGFNNCGAPEAAARLAKPRGGAIVGANVGKNKTTPNSDATADYVASARCLAPVADYLVVNVSSPNTQALRALQATEELGPLLSAVQAALSTVEGTRRVPLLVKISPDLSNEEIDAIADLALELRIDGIIATNTTTSRKGLATPTEAVNRAGEGGLSGAPLAARSLEVLGRLRRRVGSRVTLISVGGVETAADVWQRIRSGASLVQVYSALVYHGPGFIKRLNDELAVILRGHGFSKVEEAVGSAVDTSPN